MKILESKINYWICVTSIQRFFINKKKWTNLINKTFVSFCLKFDFVKRKELEYNLDYTDDNCWSNLWNMTCEDYLKSTNYSGQTCSCMHSFQLDQDFEVCFWLIRIEIMIVES